MDLPSTTAGWCLPCRRYLLQPTSFLWHAQYCPAPLTRHIDAKGAAERRLGCSIPSTESPCRQGLDTKTINNKHKDTWMQATTGGASTPVEMCKSEPKADTLSAAASYDDTEWMKTWAATLSAVRNDISPPPLCGWRTKADTEMSHTTTP